MLTSERNRLSGTKSYQYDDEGILTDIIDYSGKAVTITANAEERSHTTAYADGQTVTLQRDYAGRIVKAVSSTGVIDYEYDQGGKLTKQTDEGAREVIRYTYNSAGRRTRMTGANRDVIYTYGNNGELLTVRDYGQGLSVSYTYDAMGREVSRQYGNGGRQDTLYDEAGRTIMVRELSTRGEILRAEGYVYDSQGRRSATVDERGRVTLYRYDGQSRLSAVLYPASEALVASDEAEAQKSGTRLNGSFTLGERIFLDGDEYTACANRLEAMGYGMSRLLTSAHNQWRQAFTYDANGNRLTKTTSWGTIVYEYDGENRLLGAGTLRYAYDADGNLLSETSPYGTKTYRYSGSNRMKESRVTDLEAKTEVLTSYAYDAFGRRTLVADDGGDTMRTMYDGLSFEVFREGVAYADSSFASASSRSVPGSAMGSTNGRYVYIDDKADGRSSFVSNDSVRRIAVRYTGESAPLYAGGNRVAVNRSGNETTRGGRAYFGTDILGSVRSASGDDSVLEDRYEYDAFGVPYEGDFSSGTGAGYTGKSYDPITGLANYGYRDYSPVTARFTTVDPIRDGSNWFAYVNNDPVNYVDEWGLRSLTPSEINEAEKIFGDNLDYSNIEIITGNELTKFGELLTSGGAGVTIGNIIYFPNNQYGNSEYNFKDYMYWLLHELTHVYQYQQDGYGYIPKAITEYLFEGMDNAYIINWDYTKKFDQYDIEEQAEICEFYYKLLTANKSIIKLETLEYLDKILKDKGFISIGVQELCKNPGK